MKVAHDWKEVTKESYNTNAKEFEKFTRIFRGRLHQFIDYFAGQFKKGATILDVGCGAGRDALYLTERGLQVTGIDFSEELIRIARKKVKAGKFMLMDFEEMNFTDSSFDGIWASSSLTHVPKKRLPPILKKLYKIIKDRGMIYISFRLGQGERFTDEPRGDAIMRRFYAYYKPEEAVGLLKHAGFTNITYELDHIGIADWIGMFVRKG